MPHVIIEHNSEIKKIVDLKSFTHQIHYCLADQETVSLETIKSRTIEVDNLIIGDGRAQVHILHISVLLLTGRSESLKQTMAEALFEKAQEIVQSDSISVTVNVSELGAYKK